MALSRTCPRRASGFRYEPAELVGENAFEYVHPDDVEHATTKFAERIEHPESMPEIEFRFEHADGSWVRLHGRARNLLDNPVVEGSSPTIVSLRSDSGGCTPVPASCRA